MPKKVDMASDAKAQMLLDAIEDRKAVDPVLLDLRGKTVMTDYFLVCAGTSNTHIRAISERALERADEERLPNPRVSGIDAAEWVLIDFGDVILHVMSEEARLRYKLEQFWTTPQPKGALPPTPDQFGLGDPLEPGMVAGGIGAGVEADEDEDDEDIDDDDSAFFDEADTEVEPIEEDDEPGETPIPPHNAAGGR